MVCSWCSRILDFLEWLACDIFRGFRVGEKETYNCSSLLQQGFCIIEPWTHLLALPRASNDSTVK